MGYHFPTFRRKLRSAFSRVADNYLTISENCASVEAVCRRIYSKNFLTFSAQSVTLCLIFIGRQKIFTIYTATNSLDASTILCES